MKKIALILFAVIATTFTTKAQNAPYENWMDTIGVRNKLLQHTQFYLDGGMTLIRDTTKTQAVYTKKGAWKIYDLSIYFRDGLKGIFSREEYLNGKHIIWVKFRVKVKHVSSGKLKTTKEDVEIPFTSAGNGTNNIFAVVWLGDGNHVVNSNTYGDDNIVSLKKDYFSYNKHLYESVDGSISSLAISQKLISVLMSAQDIRVKN